MQAHFPVLRSRKATVPFAIPLPPMRSCWCSQHPCRPPRAWSRTRRRGRSRGRSSRKGSPSPPQGRPLQHNTTATRQEAEHGRHQSTAGVGTCVGNGNGESWTVSTSTVCYRREGHARTGRRPRLEGNRPLQHGSSVQEEHLPQTEKNGELE